MDVFEHGDEVVFLHRLVPGCARHSYGVQVARMAGLPDDVTARAASLLRAEPHDGAGLDREGRAAMPALVRLPALREPDAEYTALPPSATVGAVGDLIRGVAGLNVAGITPMEAINVLFSLRERAAALLRASQP
jgi:DNA mismatch repair protein MutS